MSPPLKIPTNSASNTLRVRKQTTIVITAGSSDHAPKCDATSVGLINQITMATSNTRLTETTALFVILVLLLFGEFDQAY